MMIETLKLLATFGVGAVSGFIGAMVGSGGLIIIPFLIFMGLPPTSAIATNRFGAVGLMFGAIPKYAQAGKIKWNKVWWMLPLAIIGGIVGSLTLLQIDEAILKIIIAALMIILLPLILLNKKIGIQNLEVSKTRLVAGYIAFFFLAIYAGFFGGGGGTLIIYLFMLFFGLSIIEASATGKIPWLVASLASLVVFGMHDVINIQHGTALFIGGLLGGYLGARTALQKGDAWIKKIFVIIVFVAAIKLIFF